MTIRNTHDRYGLVAMGLHWLMAISLIGMIVVGSFMVDLPAGSAEQFALYQLHKSFGITILVLTLARLGWRLANPIPPLPDNLKSWERIAARATHFGFYALMIGIPLSGWAMVSASPWNIPTVLFGIIPLPHLPVLSTLEDKKAAEEALKEVHEALGWALLGLLVLHVAAALKHQLVLKDGVLGRMVPWMGQHSAQNGETRS